jgi:hypothetical protein
MDGNSITPDTIERIHLLKNNVIDLSAALDDVDSELAPLLEQRARLDSLLREAEAELRELVAAA